jgi:hypothetical protein
LIYGIVVRHNNAEIWITWQQMVQVVNNRRVPDSGEETNQGRIFGLPRSFTVARAITLAMPSTLIVSQELVAAKMLPNSCH